MSVQAPTGKFPFALAELSSELESNNTHPMEWVAYFLGRIENHLDRIANAVEEGAGQEKLRQQLQSIDQAIRIQGVDRKIQAMR